MKLTSGDLKALYQQRTARPARQRAECPSPELLQQAASGTLGWGERNQVAAHVAVCAECAREYRLAREVKAWVAEGTATSGEEVPEGRPARELPSLGAWIWRRPWHFAWLSGWRVAAVAATIVLAVGVGVALWRATSPGVEIVPGERAGASVAMNVEPADGAMLPQPPQRLAWSAPESADRYQVVLYDFESTPIWEGPSVTSAAVTIPETVRDRLPRGRPIYWRVIAYRGVERVQSTVFQFVIAP